MRRRVTQILKNGLNAEQWVLHHCKIPHKNLWKLTTKLCFQVFFGFVYTNHGVWVQASIQNFWNRSFSLKIKKDEAISINFYFFTLAGLCSKLNDEFMSLTASPNLNAKKYRDYRQEGGRKVEATGSTCYHITLRNKIGSDCISW